MNKPLRIILIAFFIFLSSCTSIPKLPEVEGYKMLTLPSSNYQVGSLVAIYSNPPKEDIIFRPTIKDDVLMTSKSVNLSNSSIQKTEAELSAKLEKVAEGKIEGGFTKAIKFKYTNTRVIDAEQTKLYRDLVNSLENSPEEVEFIKELTKETWYSSPLAKLDVLTGILIADVEFEIDKSNNAGANVSTSELIDVLGADFKTDGTSSSKVIGKNVVIGYRADPNTVKILLKRLANN